jgi:lysophospholipase L1-like esterase
MKSLTLLALTTLALGCGTNAPTKITEARITDTGCSLTANPAIDPAKPNYLVIGDSISIEYTYELQKNITTHNVLHNDCNAADSAHLLARIDSYLSQAPSWDLITFNSGIWDLADDSMTTDRYLDNMRQVAARIKARAPHARVVFFTTTAFDKNQTRRPDMNARATAMMRDDFGFEVFDLGSLSETITHLQFDGCHFEQSGDELLADWIRNYLGI